MKKQISFFISLVLVIAAGYYFTPEYSQAGGDDPCYIQGKTGPGHGSCTVTVRLNGVIVDSCLTTGSQGNFACGPLDPNEKYSVYVLCGSPELGCGTGVSSVSCADYVDLTNAAWDCW